MSKCSYNKVAQEWNKTYILKRPYITIPSLDGQKQAEERAPMKEVFLQAKVAGVLVANGQLVDPPK